MPFTPKDWKDLPDTTTPLSSGAMKDVELRLSNYTDQRETVVRDDLTALDARVDSLEDATLSDRLEVLEGQDLDTRVDALESGSLDARLDTIEEQNLDARVDMIESNWDTHTFDTGDLKTSARSTPPSGWLLCDGAAISRTTYSDLFAAIGTTYGVGNGSTTFNVPDLRGRVPAGVDGTAGRLSANDALGNSGGSENHTLTASQLPSHDHPLNIQIFLSRAYSGNPSVGEQVPFIAGSNGWNGLGNAASDPGFADVGNSGGGAGHPNLQPYQIFNYFIKT